MDNILAYMFFDLPVMLVAKWLRRTFGWRQRRSENIAMAIVISLFGLACLAGWTGHAQISVGAHGG